MPKFTIADETDEDVEPIRRLSKDLLIASRELGRNEVRYIVDGYYQLQEYRKASNNQIRSAKANGESVELLTWLAGQAETIEGQIKRAMQEWGEAQRPGRWAMLQKGIGPVLTAGLMAHLDITKCACPVYKDMEVVPTHDCPGLQTVGHFWSFAGLDPNAVWEKGQKRPWNQTLKNICWRVGDSFVKQSGRADAVYGQAYKMRKEYEVNRNTSGGNAETAQLALANKRHAATQKGVLENGQLPAVQIDLRARRWAVKLFLSHLHQVMYEDHFGIKPPNPYVIEHLGHTDFIAPPGWPCE